MNEGTDDWLNECMHECMDAWVDERMHERMNEWINALNWNETSMEIEMTIMDMI